MDPGTIRTDDQYTGDLIEDRIKQKVLRYVGPFTDDDVRWFVDSGMTKTVVIDLGDGELPAFCPREYTVYCHGVAWTCERWDGQRGDGVCCFYEMRGQWDTPKFSWR